MATLIWPKRAKVYRPAAAPELETRTWQTACGRYRVQLCRIHLPGAPGPYWLASVRCGQGWAPISRHKSKQAAICACQECNR